MLKYLGGRYSSGCEFESVTLRRSRELEVSGIIEEVLGSWGGGAKDGALDEVGVMDGVSGRKGLSPDWSWGWGGCWDRLKLGLGLGYWGRGLMVRVSDAESDARASFKFCTLDSAVGGRIFPVTSPDS